MAPKKAGQVGGVFSEVERAFYELQLADCNRKLVRLRLTADDFVIRNAELQKAYETLDEDRAEVIVYIKKALNVKNEENEELKDKVKGLEEMRELEIAKFKRTVKELEDNFIKTKAQLTSENKLLAGKLNTLEEFRAIKDDLMQKYENNERAFEEQEMKYKRIIFDTEKKFVIGKDKLKKEMEERLLMLAQEFQDASELRIAASTHRVIRENIALNNQLDSLFMTQAKVAEQNEKFGEDEKASRCAMEAAEEERDEAINRSIVQLKVIDQLKTAFKDTKKQQSMYDKKLYDQIKLQMKMQKLQKDNDNLLLQVRLLEQNLHATLSIHNESVVETAKLLKERESFRQILKDSAIAVQASLKMDNWATLDSSRDLMSREVVLGKILEVINQYRFATDTQSTDSLVSLTNIYKKGDLGIDVTKPVVTAKAGLPLAEDKREDKRSAASLPSPVASSVKSFITAPGIEVIPAKEEHVSSSRGSLPSFTVTSLHSSYSSSVEEEEVIENEMSRMLAISKMEMQKSLMADLTFSRASKISQRKISVISSQSVATSEYGASVEKRKNIQHTAEPTEATGETTQDKGESTQDTGEPTQDTGEPATDTGEPTQDTGEPTQDTSEPTQDIGEPTQDSGEPRQDTGEPTQDTGEPVAVDKEDAKEDNKKTSAE